MTKEKHLMLDNGVDPGSGRGVGRGHGEGEASTASGMIACVWKASVQDAAALTRSFKYLLL